ncbi:MAG: prepilin-type N-terminal cleavage/methylation domain-containing protein [Acidobacteria bacterium]|nr:prepilin-type N-terminal cleavage/methylation domain-containing protein [Acidobacteriota bacterium]
MSVTEQEPDMTHMADRLLRPGTTNDTGRSAAGFSLVEVVVAMSILLVGLFGLAQVFYVGLNIASASTPNLIAREKAREAIESVHTARDTHTILWAQIRNDAAPDDCPPGTTGVGDGEFLNGENQMQAPGPDGLVSTGDDTGHESLPGPDSQLGTADDVPLVGYTRQISICDVDGNADLRQIVVTIGYDGAKGFGSRRREYRLVTFISRFS